MVITDWHWGITVLVNTCKSIYEDKCLIMPKLVMSVKAGGSVEVPVCCTWDSQCRMHTFGS